MSITTEYCLFCLYVQLLSDRLTVTLINDLRQWLLEHADEDIRVSDMAARCGLSVSRFRSLFRKRFGVPPHRYARRLRMEAAARLLRETAEPIKQVALETGFSDLANFYRAFRADYGQPPAAYRKRYLLAG